MARGEGKSGPGTALAASEALYRATFDQAALGIAHVGLDGRWLRVNDRLCAIIGYSREELLARRFQDITHPDDLPENLAHVRALLAGHASTYTMEKRYWRRDGTIVWVKLIVSVLRDADGKLLHFISTLDDISDRKRAEAVARENKRRLRQALDGLPQMAWMTGSGGRALYYNGRVAEYAGYQPDPDFEARMALVHPEDARRVRESSVRARTGETAFGAEARLRRHDGAWRWHRLHGIVLEGDGESGGIAVGTAVDIHDLKEAERALADANVELERRVADRTRALTETARELAAEMDRREAAQAALLQSQKLEALGRLTGGIAHDLNNVLAAVSGSYELIRRRTTDPALLRLVALGEKGAVRAAALVRQLLGFARREALKPVLVDPAALLAQVELLARHTVGPAIACIVDVAPEIWPVLVDPQRLEMALLNLAANARDAMPDGGTLTIAARNARENDGEFVAINVADTGTGMTEDVLAHASEPFFSTKPRGKGTGLGLASVRGFAEQSGGRMRIASRSGEGAAVTIMLARAHAGALPATASALAPRSVQRHGGKVVLLVDDDEQGRPVTAALLRDMGFSVIEAADAEIALVLAQRTATIDVLVTDVIMPGADGPRLAAGLRAERPDLPVLFITGHAGSHLMEGEAVLAKPFSARELEGQLLEVLAGGPG